MLVRIKVEYPTSRIICILPYYTTEYDVTGMVFSGKVEAYRTDIYDDVMKKICKLHKVTYVDLRKSNLPKCTYQKYLPDNIHPNPRGMKKIFEMVNKVY